MIKYYLRNNDWQLIRGSAGAAGYDIRADVGTERIINPGERWKISTGLHLEMPRGIVAQVCSRSGLAINHGITVANAPGIIDSDYRGEVMVTLTNIDRAAPYVIKPGDRIAQMLFVPYFPEYGATQFSYDAWIPVRVDDVAKLRSTERDQGGHGSTGR